MRCRAAESAKSTDSASSVTPVHCDKCRGTNVGTEEELIGTALVRGFEPRTGEFEYTGETVVYYDSALTQTSDDGRTIMFCRDCCRHFLFDTQAAAAPPAPPAPLGASVGVPG